MVDLIGRTCLYFINRCLCRDMHIKPQRYDRRENCSFLEVPSRKKRRPSRKTIVRTREFASISDIDNLCSPAV